MCHRSLRSVLAAVGSEIRAYRPMIGDPADEFGTLNNFIQTSLYRARIRARHKVLRQQGTMAAYLN